MYILHGFRLYARSYRLVGLMFRTAVQKGGEGEFETRRNNKSSKVISEERVAAPQGRECTRPLHVLAVQCTLQASPVTQLRVRYIHIAVPH